jgi:hypothetical protein
MNYEFNCLRNELEDFEKTCLKFLKMSEYLTNKRKMRKLEEQRKNPRKNRIQGFDGNDEPQATAFVQDDEDNKTINEASEEEEAKPDQANSGENGIASDDSFGE